MFSFIVNDTDSEQELFDLLADKYPECAEKALLLALKKRLVTLNGNDARRHDIVHEGDEVCLYLPGDVLGLDLKPVVVYQDENIIIVDKPAGLKSTADDDEINAVGMVAHYMKQRGEYNLDALMVPYLIYPLDEYASGLLIMAKHEDAYFFFTEALAQRRLSRYYYCVVKGIAQDSDELMGYHMRDRAGRRATILPRFKKDSKPIVTRYSKLAEGETLSLLSVRPVTNMLHQVQAHLAFCGLPVLGDDLYGDTRFNKKMSAEYMCLWLKSLVFEVGTGHNYEYINGRYFESSVNSFPRCAFEQGLMDKI